MGEPAVIVIVHNGHGLVSGCFPSLSCQLLSWTIAHGVPEAGEPLMRNPYDARLIESCVKRIVRNKQCNKIGSDMYTNLLLTLTASACRVWDGQSSSEEMTGFTIVWDLLLRRGVWGLLVLGVTVCITVCDATRGPKRSKSSDCDVKSRR